MHIIILNRATLLYECSVLTLPLYPLQSKPEVFNQEDITRGLVQ